MFSGETGGYQRRRQMKPPPKRRVSVGRALVLACVGLLAAGCDEQQNALAPKSHQATDIARLFWWMMGIAWVGLALVVAMMLLAWRRARRKRGDDPKEGEQTAFRVVIGGGIVFPIVLIAALFVVADIFVIKTTQAPAKGATELTIRVTGHQWWWDVQYPGTAAVTANEIHIPARTPVRVDVASADVIHSFWVPRLNRTIDAFPGRTNSIELYADAPGRYRGQCDEYCGLQHAHMAFYVFADPPKQFRAWLAHMEKPAAAPQGALAQRGRQAFVTGPCANCHTIRGTSASGNVGPDLTHLQTRTTLAALAIPNTPSDLAEWIESSQHVKPGNEMPDFNLKASELHALLAYLEQLH
jgi:cytochrome c oxidase subunit 2